MTITPKPPSWNHLAMTQWKVLHPFVSNCIFNKWWQPDSNGNVLPEAHHQHFLRVIRLAAWAADSDLHFYSGCTDDDGCQANASWASTATVRAYWAHLRDLRRNLAFALHSLFQAQFAAFWLPSRNQKKYCSWGRIQLSVLSLSPLADWLKRQPSTVHHFFNYSQLSIK